MGKFLAEKAKTYAVIQILKRGIKRCLAAKNVKNTKSGFEKRCLMHRVWRTIISRFSCKMDC